MGDGLCCSALLRQARWTLMCQARGHPLTVEACRGLPSKSSWPRATPHRYTASPAVRIFLDIPSCSQLAGGLLPPPPAPARSGLRCCIDKCVTPEHIFLSVHS